MKFRLLLIMVVIALLVLSACSEQAIETSGTSQQHEPYEPNDTRPQTSVTYGEKVDKEKITETLIANKQVEEELSDIEVDISFLQEEDFDSNKLIELGFSEDIYENSVVYGLQSVVVIFANDTCEINQNPATLSHFDVDVTAKFNDLILGESTFEEVYNSLSGNKQPEDVEENTEEVVEEETIEEDAIENVESNEIVEEIITLDNVIKYKNITYTFDKDKLVNIVIDWREK